MPTVQPIADDQLYLPYLGRDPTGKRPKKTIFADEGLRQLGATSEQEITCEWL
jgi:hypothetical protein